MRPPNWLWIGGLLTGLFAIHLLVDVLFCPIGTSSTDVGQLSLVFAVGTMGITFGQPGLLSACAVFAPARWTVRLFVSWALAVLLIYATLWGVSRNFQHHRIDIASAQGLLGLTLGMLFSQVPMWAMFRIRRWRVLLPQTPESMAAGDIRYSMRGMMAAVTGLCVLAAMGQACSRFVAWPASPYDWSSGVSEVFVIALLSSGLSVPVIPLIGLVLAPSRRNLAFTVVTVAIIEAVMLGIETRSSGNRLTTNDVVTTTSFLSGLYLSAVFSLLVVRACGFRLVRRSAVLNGANEPVASASIVASIG